MLLIGTLSPRNLARVGLLSLDISPIAPSR